MLKIQYQKQKLFLNNFQAGHLLDASGERTVFSSRSLISRQRWANNIFDDRNPVSIIIIWL